MGGANQVYTYPFSLECLENTPPSFGFYFLHAQRMQKWHPTCSALIILNFPHCFLLLLFFRISMPESRPPPCSYRRWRGWKRWLPPWLPTRPRATPRARPRRGRWRPSRTGSPTCASPKELLRRPDPKRSQEIPRGGKSKRERGGQFPRGAVGPCGAGVLRPAPKKAITKGGELRKGYNLVRIGDLERGECFAEGPAAAAGWAS